MFDTLSERLGTALGGLRKGGRLDEESISRAMREIRLALIEADVNLEVVNDFVARVRERALDEEIAKGLNAGQQVVKIVHEELTELLGSETAELELKREAVILLAGLQGSGKTTTAAKLARRLKANGRKPGLIPADLQRPAAIDQLEQLGRQIDVPVFRSDTTDPVEAVRSGLERARAEGLDTIIVDTAGRIQVDEDLMEELGRVREAAKPTDSLLVLDAMTGQQAVAVAIAFQERIDIDGLVLTKLDGDARGGAALSVKSVTGRPIMFASTGEKLDAIEVFHPERMASRILGMGDVLTLIERAEQATSEDEAAEMEARMRKGQFTFDDFLSAQKMLRRMGPASGRHEADPGHGPARRRRHRREQDEARRGGRALDDPARALDAAHDRRQAPPPHRERLRDDRPGRQPAPRGPQDDGEDDGPDGEGQDARNPRNGGADGRRSARRADPCRGPARAPLGGQETEGQQEAVRSSVT